MLLCACEENCEVFHTQEIRKSALSNFNHAFLSKGHRAGLDLGAWSVSIAVPLPVLLNCVVVELLVENGVLRLVAPTIGPDICQYNSIGESEPQPKEHNASLRESVHLFCR